VRLGAWKWVALALALFVLMNPVFLPYGALLNAVFSPVATQLVTLGTATLHNIHFRVLRIVGHLSSRSRTRLILGLASASVGTVIAVVISYLTARQAITGWRALAFLATAPVAVPGIVLGVGLFLSYTRPPFVLYGTLWILLVAFVTIALPAAYQQLQSAFRAVNPDLEEASRILGATRLQALATSRRRCCAPA
jgi:iron(III) transport system permease protein